MLITLKLKNIALIEIIEINFEKGLNIFTGESGSGKSLILDSLNSLFGGTNIPLNHLIRPGKQECLIEAKFNCTDYTKKWLLSEGFQLTSNEVTVARISNKKNSKILTRYSINNSQTSKKLIESLGRLLMDFAGQFDNFFFGSQDYLQNTIDNLGTLELKATNLSISRYWNEFISLNEKIIVLQKEIKDQEEKNFSSLKMLGILEEANLDKEDEIFQLKKDQLRLSNNKEINHALSLTLNRLSDFHNDKISVNSLIIESIKDLNKVVNFDGQISEFTEKLIDLQNMIQDLIYHLSDHINSSDENYNDLEELQKRLFVLKNLEQTFSLQLPELIKKRNELRALNYEGRQTELKKLQDKVYSLTPKLDQLFKTQSTLRRDIATQLEQSVMSKLKELGLENASFAINFSKKKPCASGIDNITFLFSANPDQSLAPLSTVISGGEMSRFLLALKSSISNIPDILFLDEIDNGLSGDSLASLISLIKKMSEKKQILCITHQPFLAAAAKVHFKVKKNYEKGITTTYLCELKTNKQRQNELVELLGGGFIELNDFALRLLDKSAA